MSQESPQQSAQVALPFVGEGPEPNSVNEYFARGAAIRTREELGRFLHFLQGAQQHSLFNNMLIFIQNPQATLCATATQWKTHHRRPRPDARPLIILAPRTPVLFVYDVADTEGRPLGHPKDAQPEPEPQKIAAALAQLTANAARYGVRVKRLSGSLLHRGRVIRPDDAEGTQYVLEQCKLVLQIEARLDEATSYETLVEQMAHVLLGHHSGDADRWWPSRIALSQEHKDLEVACVRYLVCGRTGLPLPWDPAAHECLDDPYTFSALDINLLVKRAGLLERMARRSLPAPASRARR